MQNDSPAWILFCYVSFATALAMMLGGILFLSTDIAMRLYFIMGTIFLVGSSITLTKTMRDQHESGKLINRIEDAKAERLLKEYHSDRVAG